MNYNCNFFLNLSLNQNYMFIGARRGSGHPPCPTSRFSKHDQGPWCAARCSPTWREVNQEGKGPHQPAPKSGMHGARTGNPGIVVRAEALRLFSLGLRIRWETFSWQALPPIGPHQRCQQDCTSAQIHALSL